MNTEQIIKKRIANAKKIGKVENCFEWNRNSSGQTSCNFFVKSNRVGCSMYTAGSIKERNGIVTAKIASCGLSREFKTIDLSAYWLASTVIELLQLDIDWEWPIDIFQAEVKDFMFLKEERD